VKFTAILEECKAIEAKVNGRPDHNVIAALEELREDLAYRWRYTRERWALDRHTAVTRLIKAAVFYEY
jgi:hypothetical protein